MTQDSKLIKTLKVRIKTNDKERSILRKWAYEVNQVWNHANSITAEFSSVPVPGFGWLRTNFTAFDLSKEQIRYRKERELDLLARSVEATTEEHAIRRKQFKKDKLRWRISSGSKKSLGWIPFKKGSLKYKNGQIYHNKQYFKVWESEKLKDFEFRSGSFSEDSRGRWYLNIAVEYEKTMNESTSSVGIDLGLKDYATCSDGVKLEANQFYRQYEEKLGMAQRAKKKKLVRTIHAKIKNRRKDSLHKFSRQVVEKYGAIFVGDVSSGKLVKTNMAKSVLDAGWYMLKTQLKYKAIARSVEFREVNEKYTSQACSSCGHIGDNSPKGMDGLGIREWICSECGTKHDRDINAAKNILRLGYQALEEGV